jgi:uncharacterized damage-inducible protein DinB
MKNELLETEVTAPTISMEQLLAHWQGHRRVTRRMIEAFPEDKLFQYSVGGMRPFAELVMEMLRMGSPGLKGLITGKWQTWDELSADIKLPQTKEELLKMWDKAMEEIELLWNQLKPGILQEQVTFFKQYDGPVYWNIFYLIDNEIHHRGQGYVYLRSLGIQPPAFWDRS